MPFLSPANAEATKLSVISARTSTHYCSHGPKAAWQFWWHFVGKYKVRKIVEGEMLKLTLQTTLLQTFCKIMLHFQVIIKSIKGPDEVERVTLKH